jgi:hypothetical protein
MNVTVNASGSREKVRATPMTPAVKKLRCAPKQESTSAAVAAIMPVVSDGDEEMAEAAPLLTISAPGKSLSRSVGWLVSCLVCYFAVTDEMARN